MHSLTTQTVSDRPCRMLFAVAQNARVVNVRVLDMEKDYAPVTKQLSAMAVGQRPDLAGRPWRLSLSLLAGNGNPSILLQAWLDDQTSDWTGPLAEMKVPVRHLSWIVSGLAEQAQLTGHYHYYVRILDEDSPVVRGWKVADNEQDEPFQLVSDHDCRLMLPSGFSPRPPSDRRLIGPARDGWLRCVFSRTAFEQYLSAAEQETRVERCWAGLGRVHLAGPVCYSIIEELTELPRDDAGPAYIVTHGRHFARLHQAAGVRLLAYLQLHPRVVAGRQVGPVPSGHDAVLAWDFEQVIRLPAVFPISLFGSSARQDAPDVAAHGYDRGVLCQVQLEVEL